MLAPEIEGQEGKLIAGRYRIDRLLGRGGMGTVWLATHMDLGSRLAIKMVRKDLTQQFEALRRFEIEAHAAAQLDSTHAVKVYDYGTTEDGVPYIVMEHLEGESLSEAIVRRGTIPLPEMTKILRAASFALDKAHALGIVHRDLKPDNVFLATNCEGPDPDLPYCPKLVDFGIAKLLDTGPRGSELAGPTQTGMVIGTPSFMSPEQLTEGGEPDALTDVWSLGVTTFAAVTGRLPFEGEVLGDIVLKVCATALPKASKINSILPVEFDEWFSRACSRSRENRFRSAGEAAHALEMTIARSQTPYRLVQNSPSPDDTHRVTSLPPPTSLLGPKAAIAMGIVLGISILAAVAGYLTFVRAESPPPTQSSH